MGITDLKDKLALGLGATLLVTLLCLASAWGGYRHGHNTAKNEGDARYAKLQKAEAEAWAESKAKALDCYVLATLHLDAAAAEHLAAQQRLAANRTIIVKEIPHATAGLAACAFGPDFLRVYNAALGLGAANAGRLPQAAAAGQPAGDAAAPTAADARLRGEAPVAASPADLLTHLADYGRWCGDTADQRDKLLELWTEGDR